MNAEAENHEETGTEGTFNPLMELGLQVIGKFSEAKAAKLAVEQRWIKDLRQHKGIYEPDVLQNMKAEDGTIHRSQYFNKITRKKTRVYDSRMKELLFPANDDKNWSIGPRPTPDVARTPIYQAILQEKLQGIQRTEMEMGKRPEQIEQLLSDPGFMRDISEEAIEDTARITCENMEDEISDQLSQIDYRESCFRAIEQGNKLGTGIIKSPLIETVTRKKYAVSEDGQWAITLEEVDLPHISHTDVWNYYPEADARSPDECEYHFELHVMQRHEVLALKRQSGFSEHADAISDYMENHRGGDYQPRWFEEQLRDLNEDKDTAKAAPGKRYQLIECWLPLASETLEELGMIEEIPEELEYAWVCLYVLADGTVIKAEIDPLPGRMSHPYHFYYFEKDETSFWAEGCPSVIRDDQNAVNSADRAKLDNAASCCGPFYERNTAALANPRDKSDPLPFAVIDTDPLDPREPVYRMHQPRSYTAELAKISEQHENNIHENTTPDYMGGTQEGSGAAETMGGLSMLMGAANIDMKDLVKNFDDGITEPVIEGIYHWNMENNERVDIKGDFAVAARGSSSLIAKEMRVGQISGMLDKSNNPTDLHILKRAKLWREMVRLQDLNEDEFVRDDNEVDELTRLQDQLNQMQAASEQLQEVLAKAKSKAPGIFREIEAEASQ